MIVASCVMLYRQDRIKDVIISGGENISSIEVGTCTWSQSPPSYPFLPHHYITNSVSISPYPLLPPSSLPAHLHSLRLVPPSLPLAGRLRTPCTSILPSPRWPWWPSPATSGARCVSRSPVLLSLLSLLPFLIPTSPPPSPPLLSHILMSSTLQTFPPSPSLSFPRIRLPHSLPTPSGALRICLP